MEALTMWYVHADADRDAAERLIERLSRPTPLVKGEPGQQATFRLSPDRERIVAVFDDLDPDWRRLIGG